MTGKEPQGNTPRISPGTTIPNRKMVALDANTSNVLGRLATRDGRSKGNIVKDALVLYIKEYVKPRTPEKKKAGRPRKQQAK